MFDTLTKNISIQNFPSIPPYTPLSEIQSVLNENCAPHMRMWMLRYQKELSGAHRVAIKAPFKNKCDAPMRGLLCTIIERRLTPALLTHIAHLDFPCATLLPLLHEAQDTDMPCLQDLNIRLSVDLRPGSTHWQLFDSYAPMGVQ